jgi:hypothetical protein
VLHVVVFGHRDLDLLRLYGTFAHAPQSPPLVYGKHLMTLLFDYLAYLAPIFGLPIVANLLIALGWLPADSSETRSRLRILSVFAIMLCGVLLVMAASFTALASESDSRELSRMYGRYYDFALPLFLISFYALGDGKPPVKFRNLLFYGILVCLLLVFTGWRFLASVQPISLTDYPEVAWMTKPNTIGLWVFWPVAALVLVYYGISGLKERTTYSIYLAATFIVGSIISFSGQHSIDGATPPDRAAALVRSLFVGTERNFGLVVGSDGFMVRRCLFGIPADPATLELPAGAVIDQPRIGKNIHWVLAFDNYDLRLPSKKLLAFAGLKILQIQAVPVAQRAEIVGAERTLKVRGGSLAGTSTCSTRP